MTHRLSAQWLGASSCLKLQHHHNHHKTSISKRLLSLIVRKSTRDHVLTRPPARISLAHPVRCRRSFHSTRTHLASQSFPNHYTTLESTPSSTPGDLKKQFYTLSKKYHPDLHPSDTTASERFVRLSTAWSILSNPSKRAAYDRDLARFDPGAFGHSDNHHASSGNGSGYSGARGGPVPTGSHSSAQAYGARPASGLSKRRGAFRGPPESFYKQGGWGRFEGKRRAGASAAASAAGREGTQTNGTNNGAENAENGSGSASSTGNQNGYSHGQGYSSAGFEVPHFDRQDHFRRQENVEEGLRKRRTMWAAAERSAETETSSGLMRVMLIAGALAFTAVFASVWDRQFGTTTRDKTTKGGVRRQSQYLG